jgi:hypothetical protein
MSDNRNPNDKTNAEAFDARDEPMDVEPAARGTPWVWIGAILLLLFIAYLIWR